MKPFFVTSTVNEIKYRGEIITNNPINLSLCLSIEKSKFSWYPDNEGLYSIKFNGCNEEWVYRDSSTRELDFTTLKTNQF